MEEDLKYISVLKFISHDYLHHDMQISEFNKTLH